MPVWFVHPSWAFVVFFLARISIWTVTALFMDMDSLCRRQVHCSRDQQPLYSEKIYIYIKNGSHSTIYTFKNYFATVFLVFSFQQNKLYPNGLLVIYHYFKTRVSCVIWVPYKIATKFASYTTNSSFKNSSFKIIIDY